MEAKALVFAQAKISFYQTWYWQHQAAASGVEISLTKDEALKNAIRAVELYMQAAKVASNDDEKSRLRGKCKLLLSRAEEIKKSPQWTPKKSKTVLESKRAISKREEIILLESSRLHGFIFPQWKSDPDDSAFIEKSSTAKYTYSLHHPFLES